MSFLARLFGFGTQRREAPGAVPPAPPPMPAAAPILAPAGDGLVPVHVVGDPAHQGEAIGLPALTVLLRSLGCADPPGWAAVLAPAMARHGITTKRRVAHLLANCLHETGRLSTLVESLNYAPDRLLLKFGGPPSYRISPSQAAALGRRPGESVVPLDRQRQIAMAIYGGEWGYKALGNLIGSDDGWRFRGHGLIQLTGRRNFTRFGKVIGRAPEELPPILTTRPGAAESACHFFAASGCLALADADDVAGVRQRINGGANGLADVQDLYERITDALRGADKAG